MITMKRTRMTEEINRELLSCLNTRRTDKQEPEYFYSILKIIFVANAIYVRIQLYLICCFVIK